MIAIILIIGFMIAAAFYYNKIIWRIISQFTEKKGKSGKISVWILSAGLGVMSCNVFSIVGIYLLHFLVISLIFELLNLLIKGIFKTKSKLWSKIYKLSVIPSVIAAVILGFGYYNARNVVRTEYTVLSNKIFNDYKVLFVSDSHYGTIMKEDGLSSLAARLNEENADFLILGGDIADENTSKDEMKQIFSVLGKVKVKYGVYYISGNHDFQQYSKNKAYTKEELCTVLSDNGISFLQDGYTYINDDILLAGRVDYRDENGQPIEKILAAADKERYIITAEHQPVQYNEAIKCGTDLIVSGHTHAGQVFPAGYFVKLIGQADLVYGHEKIKNTDAVVSSGVAGWGYPIRTEEHSEYVVINIEKR